MLIHTGNQTQVLLPVFISEHFTNMFDILHPQTGTNIMDGSVASGGRMKVSFPRTEAGLLPLSAQTVILTNDTHI
jgi:hypothetical protein